MDHYTLVRPEHLNHQGFLFGGCMLKWVDEYAWLTASLDFDGCALVTVAMDSIVFKERVLNGSILRFSILPRAQGRTSVRYSVEVFSDEPEMTRGRKVFSTLITFVRVDEHGNKTPLPALPGYRSKGGAPGAQPG